LNWNDRSNPLSIRRADGRRYENRSLNDIGDYLVNTEEVLKHPEFVSKGLRYGAEEHGSTTLDGYCYTARVWFRFRTDASGLSVPERVAPEYRAQNTFMVYVHDGTLAVMFTSFSPCSWMGEPRDHVFEEVLYDWRNDE
jgi:hypothetical protein